MTKRTNDAAQAPKPREAAKRVATTASAMKQQARISQAHDAEPGFTPHEEALSLAVAKGSSLARITGRDIEGGE
jgi:hypothetical protein